MSKKEAARGLRQLKSIMTFLYNSKIIYIYICCVTVNSTWPKTNMEVLIFRISSLVFHENSNWGPKNSKRNWSRITIVIMWKYVERDEKGSSQNQESRVAHVYCVVEICSTFWETKVLVGIGEPHKLHTCMWLSEISLIVGLYEIQSPRVGLTV